MMMVATTEGTATDAGVSSRRDRFMRGCDMEKELQPGDYIIFHRADGQCDVLKITDSGDEVYVRTVTDFAYAERVAMAAYETRGGTCGCAAMIGWM